MSYFYVMQEDSTGIFKIGVSNAPLARRTQLSTPLNPMILLWAWEMTRKEALDIERAVKGAFADKCAKGHEYLRLNEVDVLIIHALIDDALAQTVKTSVESGRWWNENNVLCDKSAPDFKPRDLAMVPERRRTRNVEVNPENPDEVIRVIHPYSRDGEFSRANRARTLTTLTGL